MMRFVITGHKGLIGSVLLDRLQKQGHIPVLCVDIREGESIGVMDKIEGIQADICFHLAAFCKINQSIENPDAPFIHNVVGTYKVLEFCRKNKIPKIVCTSSSRVLSKEKNTYTASKIYGEELVQAYAQCYKMEYVIIRPSTVYGPFNDKTRRLVDLFIMNAIEGKELKVFGDENKTLDFTYIDDFIDGFVIAMQQKNQAFNIASGKSTRVIDVANMIIQWIGKGTKGFYDKEIAQPQDVVLDISALQKLGYEPKVGIEEGIKKTCEWYKEKYAMIKKSRE